MAFKSPFNKLQGKLQQPDLFILIGEKEVANISSLVSCQNKGLIFGVNPPLQKHGLYPLPLWDPEVNHLRLL